MAPCSHGIACVLESCLLEGAVGGRLALQERSGQRLSGTRSAELRFGNCGQPPAQVTLKASVRRVAVSVVQSNVPAALMQARGPAGGPRLTECANGVPTLVVAVLVLSSVRLIPHPAR